VVLLSDVLDASVYMGTELNSSVCQSIYSLRTDRPNVTVQQDSTDT